MFAWYRDSDVCYVYLADVEDPDDVVGKLFDETEDLQWDDCSNRRNPIEDIKKARFTDSLRNSRWFTRGWTLQSTFSSGALSCMNAAQAIRISNAHSPR